MQFVSIDPGKKNTCIVVAYSDPLCQFVCIDRVFLLESHALSKSGVQNLLQTLSVVANPDAIFIVENQVAAISGKSNSNIVYNNFVQAIIIGYCHEKCLLVESHAKLRLKYLKDQFMVQPSESKTILATRLVEQLDAVWSDAAFDFVQSNPHSVPHVMDCIAQMAFEILENHIMK